MHFIRIMNPSLGYYVFHKSTLHMLILLPNFSWLIKGFSISWCHYGLKILEYYVFSISMLCMLMLLPNFWLQNHLWLRLKYTNSLKTSTKRFIQLIQNISFISSDLCKCCLSLPINRDAFLGWHVRKTNWKIRKLE